MISDKLKELNHTRNILASKIKKVVKPSKKKQKTLDDNKSQFSLAASTAFMGLQTEIEAGIEVDFAWTAPKR